MYSKTEENDGTLDLYSFPTACLFSIKREKENKISCPHCEFSLQFSFNWNN